MILHQNLPLEEADSAPQVRVTAQELARAAAAIEARKAAEEQRRSTTIPLGEAIQQLDLPATPEEMLTEIRALRSRQTSETHLSRKSRHGLGALLGISAVMGCYFALALGLQIERHIPEASAITSAVLPAPALITIQTVDSVPAGKPIYCDFETLRDLGSGKKLTKIQVVTSSQPPDNFWTLHKQNGKIYVESWATLENLLRAENGHSADIYATAPLSSDPQEHRLMRLLPVERFHNAESMHTTEGSTDEVSLHPTSP